MKDNLKQTILYSLGLVNMALVSFFGAFTPLLWLVLGAMIFDLISRMYAAGIRDDEKIESKKVFHGIYSKLGMVMLVILSLVMDAGITIILSLILGLAGIASPKIIAVMPFCLAWIFIRECTSIVENLQHAGIKIPSFITKALSITNTAIDKVNDTIGGSSNEH